MERWCDGDEAMVLSHHHRRFIAIAPFGLHRTIASSPCKSMERWSDDTMAMAMTRWCVGDDAMFPSLHRHRIIAPSRRRFIASSIASSLHHLRAYSGHVKEPGWLWWDSTSLCIRVLSILTFLCMHDTCVNIMTWIVYIVLKGHTTPVAPPPIPLRFQYPLNC